jgi:putative oxidoreductase
VESTDLAVLLLRVVFGLLFALHGYNKIANGLDGTAGWFAGIGMRWPRRQAGAAAITEIATGVLLAVGLLTPLASAGMIGVMTVAYWVDHRNKGVFIFNGGWEYVASVAVVALVVAIAGPGGISVDHALGIEVSGIVVGLGALAVGIVAAASQLAISYRPSPR